MAARILVVEDNANNLDLMVQLLRAQGHVVATATDAASGIALASHERPDVIVLDIQLPGDFDGFDAVRRIRAEPSLHSVPVVAVTALAMVGDREHALNAGFSDYLTKPIEPTTFAADIDQHLPPSLRGQPSSVDATRGSAVPSERRRPLLRGARILMVDDRVSNIDLMRSILEPHGGELLVASTVDELSWWPTAVGRTLFCPTSTWARTRACGCWN
jgi:two-component system, cell cycle response regulator